MGKIAHLNRPGKIQICLVWKGYKESEELYEHVVLGRRKGGSGGEAPRF